MRKLCERPLRHANGRLTRLSLGKHRPMPAALLAMGKRRMSGRNWWNSDKKMKTRLQLVPVPAVGNQQLPDIESRTSNPQLGSIAPVQFGRSSAIESLAWFQKRLRTLLRQTLSGPGWHSAKQKRLSALINFVRRNKARLWVFPKPFEGEANDISGFGELDKKQKANKNAPRHNFPRNLAN